MAAVTGQLPRTSTLGQHSLARFWLRLFALKPKGVSAEVYFPRPYNTSTIFAYRDRSKKNRVFKTLEDSTSMYHRLEVNNGFYAIRESEGQSVVCPRYGCSYITKH